MDTTKHPTETVPPDATETLKEVYIRLVGIHASVAESLSTGPTVVPWVEHELRDLMRYISESGAAPLKPKNRPTRTEKPADATPG